MLETSAFVAPEFAILKDWLAFHAGAHLVEDKRSAAFVLASQLPDPRCIVALIGRYRINAACHSKATYGDDCGKGTPPTRTCGNGAHAQPYPCEGFHIMPIRIALIDRIVL
ncbi:hypothetical protein [Chelatococcus asaccharovorans]|uniref:Uncharacterized protein n=1 Tax=Chelatococcus asaccharovorans TaxID=28210 RepID=A0A2V3U655_9HYPH|nr:hypothetical protein [Chelatococcus asaccharovorans]MBS7705694.1 hypothetical protein [Chelatococcus asaccharovorans]PXW58713.1 hypothetical protein C7450_10559 [Chelatococcus asaccharovorans]